MTPYEKAGFNEKSLFRSLVDYGDVRKLDIVWLLEDDGSGAPDFTNNKCRMEHSFRLSEIQELPRDSDGYYLWDGGECPVPEGWVVNARDKTDGTTWTMWRATDLDWSMITSFRVVSTGEEVKPATKTFDWNETVEEVPYDGGGKLMFDACLNVDADSQKMKRVFDEMKKSKPKLNKYQREIKGVVFDVYDFLIAYGVTCPARQHAIKKLLMAGQRGAKDERQDLGEARDSVVRSIELLPSDKCTYPDCKCPFDMGADNKCLRGLNTDYLRKGVR